jgi:uncharacterized damage-inducible protein DinB
MDLRLDDFLRQFDPPSGYRPWYGGASLLGTLRGMSAEQAAWQAPGHDHSIWQLVLHCAYSRYNVRRSFAGMQERGGFPRRGAYWAVLPEVVNDSSWKADIALLKKENQLLVEAVKNFDPARLEEQATPASRYSDLLWGIVMHDLYHVGEMQVLKRLYLLQKERG